MIHLAWPPNQTPRCSDAAAQTRIGLSVPVTDRLDLVTCSRCILIERLG